MPVTKDYNRQRPVTVMVDLGVANMGTGNGKTAKIPRGSLVIDVGLQTVTAFNSVTTGTGTVSDGTNTYVNAQDVKTVGAETVALKQAFLVDGGTITFSLAQTGGDATAGRAIGYVTYIQLGMSERIQD